MNTQMPKITKTLLIVGLLSWLRPAVGGEPTALERAVALLQAGQETVRVVCFGDSITGVYYHTGGRRAWCDMLGIALGRAYAHARLQMINAGVSGNTTAAGLKRIERDVLTHRPHIVVVMFGMNDVVRTPRETFDANLRTIVGQCRSVGAAVVLCTPNSVYPSPQRPVERLAEFAQVVRQVAAELSVPLSDCYQAYEDIRARDPLAWKLLMSETIHPSMNGHRLFAEVTAQAISGRSVSLADVAPPEDVLRFTLQRLRADRPLKLIAMPPYDRIVAEAIHNQYPAAQIEVTPWPAEGQSLWQLEQWGKTIRRQAPHLVVVAVPAAAGAVDQEAFIRSYAWVLNWSIDFGRSNWDRLVILPSVTGPLTADQKRSEDLARRVILGADAACIDRPAGEQRAAADIVHDYVRRQQALIPVKPL
jgi:lysophospholipase L1-like esterase